MNLRRFPLFATTLLLLLALVWAGQAGLATGAPPAQDPYPPVPTTDSPYPGIQVTPTPQGTRSPTPGGPVFVTRTPTSAPGTPLTPTAGSASPTSGPSLTPPPPSPTGPTPTLIPFPDITPEFPTPTRTPLTLSVLSRQSGSGGLAKSEPRTSMDRFIPLGFVLLIWLLLGLWYTFSWRQIEP